MYRYVLFLNILYITFVCLVCLVIFTHMKAEDAYLEGSLYGQMATWKFILELLDDGNAHLITGIAESSIERLKLEKQKLDEKASN